MKNQEISIQISVFHGRQAPEEGYLVGYGALIETYCLNVPFPENLSLISKKRRSYQEKAWTVYSNRAMIEDTLYKHLVFALKYEGINLLVLRKIFEALDEEEILALLSVEATGQYTRKLWFLYEWLFNKQLPIKNLELKNYVSLVNERLQYGLENGLRSSRHRIINNLPGTIDFCPLIRKTPKLEQYIAENISAKKNEYLKGIRKNILLRASAFLLLKDSKASFTIEGESPKSKRTARWGQAIGQAGMKDLSHEEFDRLQQIVIENPRFVDMGYRKKGGFVGDRDSGTFSPIPNHLSAKQADIGQLMSGLIETNNLLLSNEIDAVLAASVIAFGFVFIHPFVDGNGRIHRYLIHHVLAKKQFSQQGLIFPVSASILNHIADYQKVLESYSVPLLDFIEWEETSDHNVEVTNDTIDYYRYFDATKQAEFLYDSVKDTIDNIIPEEVNYLIKYEEFKSYIDSTYEMPDSLVSLLVRFLEQNNGKLSKRAKKNEFEALAENEVKNIEENYKLIFNTQS